MDKHKDEGVYRCEVEDQPGHKEHDEITISVLSK